MTGRRVPRFVWAVSLTVVLATLAACTLGQPAETAGVAATGCWAPAVEVDAPADASPEDVGLMVLTAWLEGFRGADCGDRQLVDYEIVEIARHSDSGAGMIVRGAYSVRSAPWDSPANPWAAGNGIPGEDDWVREKVAFLHIRDMGGGTYLLEEMGTAPGALTPAPGIGSP